MLSITFVLTVSSMRPSYTPDSLILLFIGLLVLLQRIGQSLRGLGGEHPSLQALPIVGRRHDLDILGGGSIGLVGEVGEDDLVERDIAAGFDTHQHAYRTRVLVLEQAEGADTLRLPLGGLLLGAFVVVVVGSNELIRLGTDFIHDGLVLFPRAAVD